MKIRIKIKHLVLLLGTAALLIPLLYIFIIPKIELYAAERQYEQGTGNGKEKIIQAINHPISGTPKWDLIRKYMIEPDSGSFSISFDVYVGPSSSLVKGNGNEQGRQSFSDPEKLPYLLDYINEGPTDYSLVQAAKQVALYYNSDGHLGDAISIIERAVNRLSGTEQIFQQRELLFEKAKIYADDNQLNQADELLTELKKNVSLQNWNDLDASVIQLQAQILIERSSYKEALDVVNKELLSYEQRWKEINQEFPGKEPGTPTMLTTLTSLRDTIQRAIQQNIDNPAQSVVSGTIKRSDGTPMSRVGVFLRQQTDVYHSVINGEPYQMVTDSAGRFQFRGVIPGNYQLYLGLSFEQIDGWTWPVQNDDWITLKGNEQSTQDVTLQHLLEVISPVNQQVITDRTIDFQWEKIEGAAYYQLNGTLPIENGTIGTVIQTNIKDNQINLPVEQIYDVSSGLSYESGDFSSIASSSLLGYADTNSRFTWSVEAYDANDQLITKSNGYRLNENTIGNLPFFYLKARTMTAADLLVLESLHDEALTAYKQQVDLHPTDIHSLRMIIRLLAAKALVMNDDRYEDEVLPFLQLMMKINPSENYAFKLVDYYYKREQWAEFNQAYSIYEKLLSEEVNSYYKSLYATALMKQGQMDKAYEQFEEALLGDKSHRFLGNFLAVDLYRSGSFDSALELADKYPELTYSSQTRNWGEFIKQMKQEAGNSTTYMSELREKLEWVFRSDTKQLDEWKSDAKHSHMKKFIDAVLKVN